jgi:hypothetical protein
MVLDYHFTTITGHDACIITPEATLPSNSFLNSDLPLVPVTIKSYSSNYALAFTPFDILCRIILLVSSLRL